MRDQTLHRFAARAAACGSLALLALACGARGPLDIDDESGSGPTSTGTATPDAAAPGQSTPDASNVTETPDATSVTPVPDANVPVDAPVEASLLTCGTCVTQQCGSTILTCVTNTTCAADLQCVAQCLTADSGGGGIGSSCFLNCGGGGLTGLAPLLPVLDCITQTCGSGCASVLGGLGGGLGGLL